LRSKLGADYSRRLEKALNDFEESKNRERLASAASKSTVRTQVEPPVPQNQPEFRPRDPSLNTSLQSQEGMILNMADDRRSTLTTSVNPRLRPKASSNVASVLPPLVSAVSFFIATNFYELILVSSFTNKADGRTHTDKCVYSTGTFIRTDEGLTNLKRKRKIDRGSHQLSKNPLQL
jgi:hypothetical protein